VKKKPIELIIIFKTPTGLVRFYKPETEKTKTEKNRIKQEKNRVKMKSRFKSE
jgi:hypothetical protein